MNPSAFEAAPLRYVHDVLTGEFVSLGVILLCPERELLACRFVRSHRRALVMFSGFDRVHVNRVCSAIADACEVEQERLATELRFAAPSLASLLPRLVPTADAALQFPAQLVSGITVNPQRTLDELFERYTGREIVKPARVTRGDEDVWQPLAVRLRELDVYRRLEAVVVKGPHHYELKLPHGWRNGAQNAIQAVSLDLAEPHEIRERATIWSSRLDMVRPREQAVHVSLLLGLPGRDRPRAVKEAAHDAISILEDRSTGQAELLRETEVDRVARKIAEDLAAHPA